MKQYIIYPLLKGSFLACLCVSVAFAQVQTPTDTESAMMMDAINQNAGAFDQVDLSYIHSMGMQQKAWNNPMEHLGEGQTKTPRITPFSSFRNRFLGSFITISPTKLPVSLPFSISNWFA